MKLSVIVPVYNVEAYLDYCLDSIAQQKVDGCEIILVDDCSPDKSGLICDEKAQTDPRFHVIHCAENEGLSVARNIGLDNAKGEYITFIDSDDYISPQTLEANMRILDEQPYVDVLEYPVCVHHGTARSYNYKPGKREISDYKGWIRRKGYIHSYAWNKIYKRSLWDNIRFPKGKWYEDTYTIPTILKKAQYILGSDKGLYYYCSRQDSISNTLCEKGVNDLLQANLEIYYSLPQVKGLTKKDIDDLYLSLCNHQIIKLQLGGSLSIPDHKIPLHRALFTRRPLNYRLKAILKALSGTRYCGIVANARKALKK